MPEYQSLDESSNGCSWRAMTGMEKRLVILSAVLGIVVFALAVALATHSCGDNPVPTVSPTETPTTASISTDSSSISSTDVSSSSSETTEPTTSETTTTESSSVSTESSSVSTESLSGKSQTDQKLIQLMKISTYMPTKSNPAAA